MKIIIRADDVGYTDVCNLGAFESMEHGVVTAADVMLETPGTVDALRRLKDMPWISTGWHTHFWGSPLLDPLKVPSIYDPRTGHFRRDLARAADVLYEEILSECRAQMERCVEILGKPLDTGPNAGLADDSPFHRAILQVCEEFGLPYNYCYKKSRDKITGEPQESEPRPEWVERKCYCLDPGPAYAALDTDSLTECEKYDPASYYIGDAQRMGDFPADAVLEQSWHPGYPDWYVYHLGDQGPKARNFILARIMDVEALTSERLKTWIRENRIELVNFRDALYGTRDYQRHLSHIGSNLCVQ